MDISQSKLKHVDVTNQHHTPCSSTCVSQTILQTLDKNKLELAKKANNAETTVAEKKAEIRRLEAAIAAMQSEIESGAHEVTVSNPQIE